MSIILRSHDKVELTNILLAFCRKYLHPNLNDAGTSAIEAHFEGLMFGPEVSMQIDFETVPQLRQTKINLTITQRGS